MFEMNGADALTMNDMMGRAMTQIIDSILPGGAGSIITNQLGGLRAVQSMLGIQNDPMLDAVMISNMSPYGTYRRQQERMAVNISQHAADSTRLGARRQTYEAMAKSLVDETAWTKDPRNGASYQEYIDNEVQGYMNNGAMNFVYNLVDPLGMNAAATNMGVMTSNMIRSNMSTHSNRNAFVNAKAITESMFMNNGKFAFDKADYSGMNIGEVTSLAAALTKDMDVIGDADVTNQGSLQQATSKQKQSLKNYSAALSPQKDIFGTDIPAMIKSIEELSGQSLSQQSPGRAQQQATLAIDSTSTGRYSMSQLAGVSNAFESAMGQMNIPTLNKINATTYAARAQDAAQGGFMPSNVTKREFINNAANTVLRTANSQGADELAMSYALWSQKNGGKSMEEFRSALEDAERSGKSPLGAMMELAGVSNRNELRQGMALDKYQEAKNSTFAGDMAFTMNYRRTMKTARFALSRSDNVRDVLQKITGQEYDSNKVASAFDTLMNTVLPGDVDIWNMTGKERDVAIANKLGIQVDGKAVTEQTLANMSAEDKQRVQEQSSLMNYMSTDPRYKNLYQQTFMADNMRKQAKAVAIASGRRDYMKGLDATFADSASDLVNDILGITTGSGFDTANIDKIFNKSDRLKNLGTPEARLETAAAMSAAALINTGDSDIEKKNKMVDLARYANSTEGLGNEGFRKHLSDYIAQSKIENPTDAQKKQREQAAAMMTVYRTANPDAVDDFLKNNNNDASKLVEAYKTGGGVGLKNFIKANAIDRTVQAAVAKNNPDQTALNKEWLQAATEYERQAIDNTNLSADEKAKRKAAVEANWASSGVKQMGKLDDWVAEKRKAYEKETDTEKRASNLKNLDNFVSLINKATQGQVGQAQSFQDILKSLPTVLSDLVKVMEQLAAKLKTNTDPVPVTKDKKGGG